MFEAFFVMALICIVSLLTAERLRAAGRSRSTLTVEVCTRDLYATATAIAAILSFAA